jgi:hypothetical protein
MSRIVIVILIYHRHKLIDLILTNISPPHFANVRATNKLPASVMRARVLPSVCVCSMGINAFHVPQVTS